MTITQIDAARQGIITDAMKRVAEKERKAPEEIRACVAAGTIAIPANINHKNLDPEGVGTGLRTKVNVNLGISGDLIDPEVELEKVRVALELGAEGIMDLSNHGKTQEFRKQLLEMAPVMIGTVPMYDAIGYLEKALISITPQDFLDHPCRHEQARDRIVQRDGAFDEHRLARRFAHLRLDGSNRQRESVLRILR